MGAASGSDDTGLEASIDALYELPLEEFTARRNALAAGLKAAGNRAAADRVKGLAKPGVTAWAVNQAWWRDQAAFRAMLESGGALREAHLAHAQGKEGHIREAADERSRAVDAVVRAAVDALGGPDKVAPDVRFRILGTVESLASSGQPPGVTIGRLVKDVQASGFEALSSLAGLAPAATPPPRPVIVSRRPEPKAGGASTSREADRAEKAEAAARERARRLEEAKRRLADREAALRSARAEAAESAAAEKKARVRLEKASERAADLERQLEEAREQERAARQQLAQAVRSASEAQMVEARTARDVSAARDAVSAEKERKP